MAIIIPAILAKTLPDFQNDLSKLLNSKTLNSGWVHVDFMDNIFVPNQSIKPEDLADIDFGNLKKEAHLMVNNPEGWIKELINLNFDRIIIHVETEGVKENIEIINNARKEVGLAINPQTPIEALEPYKNMVDVILVMGVHPGFQGQSFIPQTLDKIKQLASQGVPLEVDGAVKDTNAKEIVDAGADILASGSYLINGNPDQNLARLLDNFSSARM